MFVISWNRRMSEPLILCTEQPGVVRLTLNRPHKRNAMTRELLFELRGRLNELTQRQNLRLLVLTASGTVFCAGMDLAQMQETASRSDASALWHADTEVYRDVVRRLFHLPYPTLAVLPGPAVAGGVGLVVACDLAIAAESATFALPEPKRGITSAVVTPLLVHRVGMSAAAYLLLSGESIDAQQARQMRLCHRVVAGNALPSAALEFERSILSGAPQALATTKRHLRDCAAIDVDAHLNRAVSVSAQARESAEAREGLQAFLEKRSPNWVP